MTERSWDVMEVVREFAHDLAQPGHETRAVRMKTAHPGPEVESGDLVVFEAGRFACREKPWLVVKTGRDGTTGYSFTRSPSQCDDVRGRVLFVVRQRREASGKKS